MNEETWERKERERREEEIEKKEEDRLEAFRREKMSVLNEENGCQSRKKRKASWIENDNPGQHHPCITESVEKDSHLPADGQHQHVEEGNHRPEGDTDKGLEDGRQHQHVAEEPDMPNRQHQNTEAGSTPPSLVLNMGLATSNGRKKRRAGPSMDNLALGLATNRRAVTTPIPAIPEPGPSKRKRKEMDYNLNCWNLWWKRMEREGMKEGLDRRLVNLQRPASSYFTTNKKQDNFEYPHTTPGKRKCELRMEPDISSHNSVVESPAKRRKTNFLNLVKYWGGEKGGGVDGATLYMNTPSTARKIPKINIQITAQTMKVACSKSSQLVGGGRDSESGRHADTDLEGEEQQIIYL